MENRDEVFGSAHGAGGSTDTASIGGTTDTAARSVARREWIPESVSGAGARQLYDNVNGLRRQIKDVAVQVKFSADSVKKGDVKPSPREDRGEVIANLMLTYRALEDASMRLGKTLQAMDGGDSVYDRQTTVGA